MRELLPRLSCVGVLVNVTNPVHVLQWNETQAAAAKAAIALVPVEIDKPEQLEAAFATFVRERPTYFWFHPTCSLTPIAGRLRNLRRRRDCPQST